jgi:hypothetical protein
LLCFTLGGSIYEAKLVLETNRYHGRLDYLTVVALFFRGTQVAMAGSGTNYYTIAHNSCNATFSNLVPLSFESFRAN